MTGKSLMLPEVSVGNGELEEEHLLSRQSRKELLSPHTSLQVIKGQQPPLMTRQFVLNLARPKPEKERLVGGWRQEWCGTPRGCWTYRKVSPSYTDLRRTQRNKTRFPTDVLDGLRPHAQDVSINLTYLL